MRDFTIIPYVGPAPLRFGMSPGDVSMLLGPPSWHFRDEAGILIEERSMHSVNVGYSESGELREAVFSKGASLVFNADQLLVNVADPTTILRQYKPGYNWLSSVVFPDLGVLCTSILTDEDESEWSITVAVAGHWAKFRESFVPL